MADNYNVKDASGTTIAIAASEVSSGVFSNKTTIILAGAAVASGNPFPVELIGAIPAGANAIGSVTVTSLPALAAGSNLIGKVNLSVGGADWSSTNPGAIVGIVANPSASFTRPADTNVYAAGDLVANSTTAGSVTPMSFTVAREAAGSFMLRRAVLKKTGTSLTDAWFRLYLYRSSPTPANGDNGAFSTANSGFIGSFDFIFSESFTDGSVAVAATPTYGSEMSVKLASGQVIYGLMKALGPYVPISSEVFTIELDDLQN